jgi:peroxiredoxin
MAGLALAPALAVAIALAGVPAAFAASGPEIGKPAPDFQGVDSNGRRHDLRDYRGHVVVLEWTNHECPFVAKHYGSGNMQRLQAEAKAAGVVWLSVVSSAPGRQGHVSAAAANGLTVGRKASPAAVLLDPEGTIGRAYGAAVTPHMFVIAKDGTLTYKGAIDDRPTADPADVPGARNHVRAALAEVAAGKAVGTPATRAYGCTVKYGY